MLRVHWYRRDMWVVTYGILHLHWYRRDMWVGGGNSGPWTSAGLWESQSVGPSPPQTSPPVSSDWQWQRPGWQTLKNKMVTEGMAYIGRAASETDTGRLSRDLQEIGLSSIYSTKSAANNKLSSQMYNQAFGMQEGCSETLPHIKIEHLPLYSVP